LREWNAAPSPVADPQCVHELFEEQARRTPEAAAVVLGPRPWSYAELEGRANQLARALRRRGLTAETRVAICAERSPEMVAGCWGC